MILADGLPSWSDRREPFHAFRDSFGTGPTSAPLACLWNGEWDVTRSSRLSPVGGPVGCVHGGRVSGRTPWNASGDQPARVVIDETPLENMVVRFDGPPQPPLPPR